MVNEAYITRIKEKTVANQLLNELRVGYGYPPAIAQSIVDTVTKILSPPLSKEADIGVISYLATPATVGASAKLKDIPFKRVRLTLQADDDPETYRNHGIAALRQAKIIRLTEEAYEQGTVLTTEDLSVLLCSAVRTVEYDLHRLRDRGLAVRTRGHVKGIGLRASHRAWIIGHYLDGCEMDELVRRTRHGEPAIENYLETFKRIVLLTSHQLPEDEIAATLGISRWLVTEYQQLIQEYASSSRLKAIKAEGIPEPVKKKEITRHNPEIQ